MVVSSKKKAVIKNDFIEKEWSVHHIYKEHPTKNWNNVSVQRPLTHFKKHRSMDRRPRSERRQTKTSKENKETNEDLICLQEENSETQMSPREIEKYTGITP